MRRKVVAGNWKMHGNLHEAVSRCTEIVTSLPAESSLDIIVFPPFVHLSTVATTLVNSPVTFGAQTVCAEENGAFTGEVSAAMLQDIGCRYVLVGHSERRALFGETNEVVAAKFIEAQKLNITPILCVGETLVEREAGLTEQVVAEQLQAVVECAGMSAVAASIIAYEPVWAIGTGQTATPAQANDVHRFLRRQLGAAGEDVRILYGGSVKPSNAEALFAEPDIDGGLIGGASLVAADFIAICDAAESLVVKH